MKTNVQTSWLIPRWTHTLAIVSFINLIEIDPHKIQEKMRTKVEVHLWFSVAKVVDITPKGGLGFITWRGGLVFHKGMGRWSKDLKQVFSLRVVNFISRHVYDLYRFQPKSVGGEIKGTRAWLKFCAYGCLDGLGLELHPPWFFSSEELCFAYCKKWCRLAWVVVSPRWPGATKRSAGRFLTTVHGMFRWF